MWRNNRYPVDHWNLFNPLNKLGHLLLNPSDIKAPQLTFTLVCFAIFVFLGEFLTQEWQEESIKFIVEKKQPPNRSFQHLHKLGLSCFLNPYKFSSILTKNTFNLFLRKRQFLNVLDKVFYLRLISDLLGIIRTKNNILWFDFHKSAFHCIDVPKKSACIKVDSINIFSERPLR